MASSLFSPHAWQSFSTICLQVYFGLPLGLAPSTSYSIHFFTQSLSSFRNTCPYHCHLFHCSTEITSSNPSLSLSTLYLEFCLVVSRHTSTTHRLVNLLVSIILAGTILLLLLLLLLLVFYRSLDFVQDYPGDLSTLMDLHHLTLFFFVL